MYRKASIRTVLLLSFTCLGLSQQANSGETAAATRLRAGDRVSAVSQKGKAGKTAAAKNKPPLKTAGVAKEPLAKTVAKTRTGVKSNANMAAEATRRPRKSSHLTFVPRRNVVRGGPWREPTFADSSSGDWIEGEDLQVRRAAEEALGPYNGTVVVSDPYTGRILALVNQKLALKSGFQPCSTIKVVVGLAALSEGLIDRETPIRLTGRMRMTLTEALAVSNNPYFAVLGEKLGFDRVNYYARLFGLGERAGLNIDGENPGIFPAQPSPLGVGMMASFGSGISLTPLELAAFLGAIANGGTLYYMQHPKSREEAKQFIPRVKRHLDIARWIPDIRPGMIGAVEYGTARRAGVDNDDPILGKTGTCTDERSPTHLGWFGSFNDVGRNKLVVVVLLTGGRPVNGPVASGVAGAVYRNLSQQNYFAQARQISPAALVTTQACCAR